MRRTGDIEGANPQGKHFMPRSAASDAISGEGLSMPRSVGSEGTVDGTHPQPAAEGIRYPDPAPSRHPERSGAAAQPKDPQPASGSALRHPERGCETAEPTTPEPNAEGMPTRHPDRSAGASSSRHPERSGAAAQPKDLPGTGLDAAPRPGRAARRRGNRKSRLRRALPYAGLALGLAVLLYFPATEGIDAWRRSRVAVSLDAAATDMGEPAKEGLLAQARAYNRVLAGLTPEIPADQILPYERQLSADGHDTAFAYLVAPTIGLTMPVYHGTGEAALSAGAGHLETSSLPVGGDATHAVITAHSGMEGMRAFDDIRLLGPGEVFAVSVLGDLYCYEVTGTETVLPEQAESLAIEAGQDLCTLVTCTPYGVNTHRLLVHAKRCEEPAGFLDERPSLARVASNRRVWPAIAGLTAAGAVAVTGGALAWKRRKKDEEEQAATSPGRRPDPDDDPGPSASVDDPAGPPGDGDPGTSPGPAPSGSKDPPGARPSP